MESRLKSSIIFFAIFLVGVGFSIIIPVLPYYAESMGASALTLGLLLTVYALCQFLCSPWWGRFSDRIGRKPVLLIGTFGFSLTFALLALSTELWMLFAARIAGGILSCATLPTAMAYIADTSSIEKRAGRMGMVGASMGVGMVVGPALGGILSRYGASAPFVLAAGLAFVNCLMLLFFLGESLPAEQRTDGRQGERLTENRMSIKEALSSEFALLFVALLLGSMAEAINNGTFALFAEYEVGMGAADIGWAFMFAGMAAILVQGVLVGRLISRCGEEKVAIGGLLLLIISYICFLETSNAGLHLATWLGWGDPGQLHSIYLALYSVNMAVFSAGVSLMRPSITAAVSKRTRYNQGSAMGRLNSFDSLGRVIGPSLGGWLLDLNHAWAYPGGIAIAGLAALSLLLSVRRYAGC